MVFGNLILKVFAPKFQGAVTLTEIFPFPPVAGVRLSVTFNGLESEIKSNPLL